jgi:hypothetical protein
MVGVDSYTTFSCAIHVSKEHGENMNATPTGTCWIGTFNFTRCMPHARPYITKLISLMHVHRYRTYNLASFVVSASRLAGKTRGKKSWLGNGYDIRVPGPALGFQGCHFSGQYTCMSFK